MQPALFSSEKIQQKIKYIDTLNDNNVYAKRYSVKALQGFCSIFQDYYRQYARWGSYAPGDSIHIKKLHSIMMRACYDRMQENKPSQHLYTVWTEYQQLLTLHKVFSALPQAELAMYNETCNKICDAGKHFNHKEKTGVSINKACVGLSVGSAITALGFFAFTSAAYPLYKAINATDPVEMLVNAVLSLVLWGGGMTVAVYGLFLLSSACEQNKGRRQQDNLYSGGKANQSQLSLSTMH